MDYEVNVTSTGIDCSSNPAPPTYCYQETVYLGDYADYDNIDDLPTGIISLTRTADYIEANGINIPSVNTGGQTIDSVIFKAGNYILIEDVFCVNPGSFFLAEIDPCDNGTTNSQKPPVDRHPSDNELQDQPVESLYFKVYPNPFRNFVQLEYEIQNEGEVDLKIYDMFGRQVEHLINKEIQEAGKKTATFANDSWPAGLYHFLLNTEDGSITKKAIKIE
jgi:hypothetical protein